jgi:hypothetical protein
LPLSVNCAERGFFLMPLLPATKVSGFFYVIRFPTTTEIPMTKRHGLLARFALSYLACRSVFGRWQSFKAAMRLALLP